MCGAAGLDYYNGGGPYCWTRSTSTCEPPDKCKAYGRKVRARRKLYRRHLRDGPLEVIDCEGQGGAEYQVGVYKGQDRAVVLRRAKRAGLFCEAPDR